MRRLNLMVMVLLTALLFCSSPAWSLDRFVDLNDGTMLDTVSSLRWLQNANCYGTQIGLQPFHHPATWHQLRVI